MNALTFNLNMARLATAKLLGAVSRRGHLSRLGPVALVEVPEPTLPAEDWVLIATRRAGICGSDVKQVFLDGSRDNPLTSLISFPHIMGHEIAGQVAQVGSRVGTLRGGDRVAVFPWLTCVARGLPLCASCRTGDLPMCANFTKGPLGTGMHLGTSNRVGGGFAPLLAAHESMCFRIPDHVSFDDAALADPFSVAMRATLELAPEPGARVLVFGCGAIGLVVVQILRRLFRGVTILAVDLHEHLADLARRFGANEFWCARGVEVVEHVAKLVGAEPLWPWADEPWLLDGVDAVVDTVGSAETLATALRVVRPRGKVIVTGVATPSRFEWTPLYFKEVSMRGSNGCGIETFEGMRKHCFAHYLDLLDANRIDPAPLVTHRFPLAQYVEAFMVARDKERHRSIKVMFEMPS